MKRKVTITLNKDLIPKAMAYASAEDESLSGLIERLLAALLEKENKSFSEKWKGKFVARSSNKSDERSSYLAKRFLE